MKQESLQMFLT